MIKIYPEKDRINLLGLVEEVKQGDKDALDKLLRALKDGVFAIALKMVTCPHDAEDITQEVLIKVITKLSTFRGDASPRTWVYRLTVNHILDRRKSRVEALDLSFDSFGKDLMDGLSEPSESDFLLADEVKYGCTLAMLTCLDREHRIAYVLGEIFDLPGRLAAEIAGAKHDLFRQRLSRARIEIESFTEAYCGVVNPQNVCRCEKKVQKAIRVGRVNPQQLVFSDPKNLKKYVEEVDLLNNTASVMRNHPEYAAPERLIEGIRSLLENNTVKILNS
ncbi:MAG: hypothetical protein CTY34_01905 [Methylobacter sp.]|nr:MAG: hypothetical protein CTY34_01905 [Methylobacter sp.]PPD22031.1 MAG: hypothetical protein CTY24_06935 [Methylobacter sp.]PPD37195.1 MAG: hypothetical protein CTY18_02490 [Methylomonas sp.]